MRITGYAQIATLLLCVALTGCGGKSTVPHLTDSRMSWHSTGENEIKGTETATVSIVHLYEVNEGSGFDSARDKEVSRIVIWEDGAVLAKSQSGAGGRWVSRRVTLADGGTIDWKCEAVDLQTLKVTINDKVYDPSKGRLFLVSTTERNAKVLQLDRDVSKFQLDDEWLKNHAENDAEVSGFFRGNAPPE